jgi:integrase
MPARQRGQVVKRGSTWAVRFYDESGIRRSRGGFTTKSEARAWVDRKVDEVEALRSGEQVAPTEIPTVSELVEQFLATHEVDPATTDKLRYELKHITRAFGERRLDTLRTPELATWRMTLPARSRHQLFRSTRQVLEQAVVWNLIERNPTDRIRNRRVRLDENRERRIFEDWDEVEAVAAEMIPAHRALPIFLVGTGMRPEEALALEWRDIDKREAVASIERVHSKGRTKACKKSDRQRRRVPLRDVVLEALDAHPRRLGTRLVFPAHHADDYLRLDTFYLRHWRPALRGAGLEPRGVYTCRHTFASWALRGGMDLFLLSKFMGTSIAMLDAHYGHLVRDSEDHVRALLNAYDFADAEAAHGGLGT